MPVEQASSPRFVLLAAAVNIFLPTAAILLLPCCTMTTPKPSEGTGDIASFNIHHGFAEALVRGMRSSFLQDQDYHHLTQCETLDDVRLNLTETDYSDAIADFNSLTPNTLQKAAVDKVGTFINLL